MTHPLPHRLQSWGCNATLSVMRSLPAGFPAFPVSISILPSSGRAGGGGRASQPWVPYCRFAICRTTLKHVRFVLRKKKTEYVGCWWETSSKNKVFVAWLLHPAVRHRGIILFWLLFCVFKISKQARERIVRKKDPVYALDLCFYHSESSAGKRWKVQLCCCVGMTEEMKKQRFNIYNIIP